MRTFMLVIPAQAGQARSAQNARRAAPQGRAQRVIQCLGLPLSHWISLRWNDRQKRGGVVMVMK